MWQKNPCGYRCDYFFDKILANAKNAFGEGTLKRDGQKTASDLMDSTVRVIARDGFDKASTRSIAGEIGLADPYIYQYFSGKEALFSQTFRREDAAFAGEIRKHLPIMEQKSMSVKDRCRILFDALWQYLMQHPDSCRFYVQYYYSPYYQKNSSAVHLEIWQPMMANLSAVFRPETDVKFVLRLALNTTLDLAVKTLNPGCGDDAAEQHFELVYSIMAPWLNE